uniref:Protoporphyrinogen oxidase n=1 Tax=Clastoptera arizonana TaxID=38151 RepID=A0A1B6CHX2_9HEMI
MSVGILGGGLGGLSAAYYLARSTKCKSIIFESSDSVGGWIKSINDTDLNVLFEKGPRTIRPKGLQGFNTLCLIEELNLADKVIPIRRNHPTAKNRMIYVNKKIHSLPSSFYSLLKTSSPFSKPLILAIFKDLLSPKQMHSDESIYNFVERRLGKDIADFAISPMICGICAGNAKEISVKFLMESLFEAEQKHGSIVKGLLNNFIFQSEEYPSYIKKSSFYKRVNSEKWSVWYLEGGFQKLTDALNERVQNLGVNISLNSSCTKLEFRNKQIICHIGNNEFLFNHLLSSISAKKLAPLLSDQHPFLSQELDKIPMVSVAVVNVAYKGKHLKDNAFGLLVPPSEKLSLLGIVFDSCNFSYTDRTVLTVMMGDTIDWC